MRGARCLHSIFVAPISALLAYGITPAFLELLRKGGATRQNYLGTVIPVGAGFLIVWSGCISGLLWMLQFPSLVSSLEAGVSPFAILLFSTTALGYGMLGLLDDLVGSRQEKGLRGHGAALMAGRLTSGTVKAVLGVAFGMILAAYHPGSEPFSRQWSLMLPVDALVIAASANTLNLLDLRPGRAGKVFLFSSLLLITSGNPLSLVMLPWIGSQLGYLPFELEGKAMMGDVGANALGALLGLASCSILSFTMRLILLSGLISIHILAERVSLSDIIERHSVLRALDRWGRKDS